MKKFLCLLCLMLVVTMPTFAGTEFEVPETIKVQLKDGSVEEIDLDTYLYSVVQSEMGLSYKTVDMSSAAPVPLESLKAQAVASRSYAVYKIINAGSDVDFHVTSTTSSQVYKDNININERVIEAVDSTSGQVVLYDGKIACTYFFSTSGGHTEASENVWSGALPYLRGVEDTYEINVKNCSSWDITYSFDELEELFPNIGEIEDIEIVSRSENDRVTELEFIGTKGTKKLIKNAIRLTLGASKIRSQWFEIEVDDDEVTFSGRGYGHGIGMSQNGAIGMGIEGFEYNEIIHWYYTDVEIVGEVVDDWFFEDDEELIEDEEIENDEIEDEEVVVVPKPLLDATTQLVATNWLQAILFANV